MRANPVDPAAVVADYARTQSLRKTAANFAISHERVRQLTSRAPRTPQTPQQQKTPHRGARKLVELYLGGFTVKQAARKVHMSRSTALIYLDRAGIKRRHSNG